jgi:hypothetical protein
MNMNLSELINEIVSEWAYRVNDGMPDAKNPIHVKELSIVLNEMGLSHIKDTLIENLLTEKGKTPEKIKEADKNFTNPILNKKVNYKAKDGSDKEGIVGNLLRQPEGTPARDAAEKMLPPEGSEERDSLNKELGGEGQPKKPEDGKEAGGGEEGGAPKEDPIKKAAHMFDPKVDPAMASRLDKEKAANDKLVQKDKEASDREAELSKKDEPANEFNPINAQDVAKEMPGADPETFGGGSDIPDGVEPEQLKKFNTDISKVAQQVADAKAKGEPAPNINLCDVTVPGTNLYCDDNLGIPRDEMPQFKGNAAPGSRAASMDVDASGEVDTEPVFKEMLKEKGIKTLQTEIPADRLKATQKDLVGAKVVGMMGALEKDPNHPKITAPIYVSRDGHVIDGHHRWAAIVAHNAANPDKQIPMKTTVLDMDIKDAIPMANKFAEDMGIAAKKADANKETPSTPTSVGKNGLTDKIKQKIENWTKEEKAFFEKNEGAPASETRRSLGQALKDKAAGAWKAIKKGAKHEVEEFKSAGEGVTKFFKGEKLTGHEKKALKAVAIKVVTTAVFGAAFGGLSHGVAAFGKHVAMEFIPHVVGETILKGAGKAALFADMEGEAEMDANMEKFAEMIAKGLEEMEITDEMMEQMVDSYNKKKENGETDNVETPIEPKMKEENLQLAHELMLEMIYGFINEATRKEGESKKYPGYFHTGGGYYSKKAGGEITHKTVDGGMKALSPKEKAEKNKNQTPTKKPEVPTQDLAPTDFRPTPDMEQPNQTPTTTKKKKGKKNKELNQTKNTKGEFNEGNLSKDGVTDEQFAANKKIKPTPSQIKVSQIEKFFLDKKGNTKFPKKYIKVLARMLSTKPGGVTISDFTDASGAGTLSSTMGELLTLMAVTIKDNNEAKEFFGMLREHIKVNGKDSIIDIGWVNSAEKVRQTQFNRYDRKYGRGNWELDNMAWDVESEVEAMGMENYKQNKGFSTDVYAKVKVGGKYILDEISLKKEIKANLLNATSGRVADIMVRGLASDEDLVIYDDLNSKIDSLMGLKDSASKKEKAELIAQRDAIVEKYNVNVPDDVKVSKVQKKQRLLHEDFVKKGVGEVSGFLKKFCNKKDTKYRSGALNTMKNALSQKDDYKPKVNEQLDSLCSIMPKGGFKTPEDYNNALKQLKIGDTSDIQKLNMGLMSAIAAENPQSQAAKSSKMIIKNSHNHSKAVREFLLKDPAARKGLLGSIREAFPLKALFEGEENMILGDVSVDKDVLTNVFGVDSYDQLEQKLTVRDTPPPPSIVYRVAGKEDIPVAEIVSRPDGIGYGGSWKLIMAVHPDFAKKLKESNDILNSKIK